MHSVGAASLTAELCTLQLRLPDSLALAWFARMCPLIAGGGWGGDRLSRQSPLGKDA